MPIEDGRVLYLNLDGNFVDSSSSSNDGVSYGTPFVFRKGAKDDGAIFNGTDQYVASIQTLPVTAEEWTISLWFYLSGDVDEPGFMFMVGTNHNGFGLSIDNTDGYGLSRFGKSSYGSHINVTCVYGGIGFFDLSNQRIHPKVWNHVALRRTGGTTEAFVNGKKLTFSLTDSPYPPTGGYTVGGHRTVDRNYFSGELDEIMLWDRGLSDEEILNFYNSYFVSFKYTDYSRKVVNCPEFLKTLVPSTIEHIVEPKYVDSLSIFYEVVNKVKTFVDASSARKVYNKYVYKDSGVHAATEIVDTTYKPSILNHGLHTGLPEYKPSILNHGLHTGLPEYKPSILNHGLHTGLPEYKPSILNHGLHVDELKYKPSELNHGLHIVFPEYKPNIDHSYKTIVSYDFHDLSKINSYTTVLYEYNDLFKTNSHSTELYDYLDLPITNVHGTEQYDYLDLPITNVHGTEQYDYLDLPMTNVHGTEQYDYLDLSETNFHETVQYDYLDLPKTNAHDVIGYDYLDETYDVYKPIVPTPILDIVYGSLKEIGVEFEDDIVVNLHEMGTGFEDDLVVNLHEIDAEFEDDIVVNLHEINTEFEDDMFVNLHEIEVSFEDTASSNLYTTDREWLKRSSYQYPSYYIPEWEKIDRPQHRKIDMEWTTRRRKVTYTFDMGFKKFRITPPWNRNGDGNLKLSENLVNNRINNSKRILLNIPPYIGD